MGSRASGGVRAPASAYPSAMRARRWACGREAGLSSSGCADVQAFHGKPGIWAERAQRAMDLQPCGPGVGLSHLAFLGRVLLGGNLHGIPTGQKGGRWALQSSIKPGRAGRRPCDGGGALGCSHGMCPHLVRLEMPGRLGRGRSCSHDPGKPFGNLSMSRFGALELRRARGRGHGMCPRLVRLQMPHRSPSLCRGGSAALSSGPHFGRLFEAAGFRGARAVGPSATQPCVPVAGGQRR